MEHGEIAIFYAVLEGANPDIKKPGRRTAGFVYNLIEFNYLPKLYWIPPQIPR